MNTELELHDSVIARATRDDCDITLLLSPGIVHESRGSAGIDSGEIFLQDLSIVLRGVDKSFVVDNVTCGAISDGVIKTAQQSFENSCPTSLVATGNVRLEITMCSDGSTLSIEASAGVELSAIGERIFLERFE